MFDYIEFGLGIKQYRKARNLSAFDLAKLVGISERYLLKIEKGIVKPSTELVVNLCNVLNVSVNDCLQHNEKDENVMYRQFKSETNTYAFEEKRFIGDVMGHIHKLKGDGI